MTTFEEMPSVRTAVEREAQRRKRVLLTFLALLAVPIAIGAYAIAKAPSETEAVAARVAPIVTRSVTERVDQQIEPRVQEMVARQAEPVIQRTLDTKLDAAVQKRVQPLEREVRAYSRAGNPEQRRMTVRIQQLEERVAELEKRLAALSAGGGRVPPSEGTKDRPAVTYVPKRPQ